MLTYEIDYLTGALPELRGQAFDPDVEPFCLRPCADIEHYVWPGEYRPEARAYAAWNEKGLHLLLCAWERTVSAETTAFNGPVYRDSCLEFFFGMEGSSAYMNIEVNAAGCALIGFGTDRERRACLPELPEGMDIRASKHEGGWWALSYTVPAALKRNRLRERRMHARQPSQFRRLIDAGRTLRRLAVEFLYSNKTRFLAVDHLCRAGDIDLIVYSGAMHHIVAHQRHVVRGRPTLR